MLFLCHIHIKRILNGAYTCQCAFDIVILKFVLFVFIFFLLLLLCYGAYEIFSFHIIKAVRNGSYRNVVVFNVKCKCLFLSQSSQEARRFETEFLYLIGWVSLR